MPLQSQWQFGINISLNGQYNSMSKSVVVFGATGTVGAYACLYLKEKGYRVTAVGHRRDDNGFFADYGIPYYSADISRKEDFDNLPDESFDAAVNLAGMLPARMKGYCPQKYIDINVTGCLNVLDYCVKAGCKRFVYSQSISDVAYLCGNKTPIPSDAESRFPLNNDHSVYSITKNAASSLIDHYSAKYGFKFFILRFPNIYLYHPNPRYYVDGVEKWQGYRLMIAKAMKGEPISVWGDPGRVHDVVYVKDCCQIIERSIGAEDAPSGRYNVGTGVGTTLEDQIRGIIEVFSPEGSKSELSYDPSKPSATEYVFDVSKTEKYLGYRPQYDYLAYLRDFKKEMEAQRFVKLWGPDKSLG